MNTVKQKNSINRKMLLFILFCWAIPILACCIFASTSYYSRIVEKEEELMIEELINVASFSAIHMSDVITLSQRPSYEKTLENAWKNLEIVNSYRVYVPPVISDEPAEEPELTPVALPYRIPGRGTGTADSPWYFIWSDDCRFDPVFINNYLPALGEGFDPAVDSYPAFSAVFEIRENDSPNGEVLRSYVPEVEAYWMYDINVTDEGLIVSYDRIEELEEVLLDMRTPSSADYGQRKYLNYWDRNARQYCDIASANMIFKPRTC